MIRYLAALALSISLAGCASKYRVDAYEAPSAHLDKQASFYVVLPADGHYGSTVYAGSGATAAQAVASALSVHVDKAVIGMTAGEELDAALAEARQRTLTHVFMTTILNWEDRATEWSGIPDKVTLKFAVMVDTPVRTGHHGIALFNHERQLIWGYGTDNLQLPPGEHEFSYAFPMLPLRPGSYTWLVSLYDDAEQLDFWECAPEMVVATEPVAHKRDEWSGLLNLPTDFSVLSKVERSV